MNQLQPEQYRKVNQSEYPCSDHPKISLMRTESCAEGRSQTAEHPLNEYLRGLFPFGSCPRRLFLVYIAAVLFYKPIFTQPLSFVLCTSGAVEKFATDGTVSVVYLRDSIGISKINAAFLTGQQIDRIHVQQLLLKCFERDACWTSLSIK